MRSLLVPAAFLAFAVGASAQSNDSAWQNLQQLQPGDRIEVVLKSNAKHHGTFTLLADDAITVRTARGETGFRRDEVARVSRRGETRRRRSALMGLAAGAGVGAVVGAAVSGRECNGTGFSSLGPCLEPTRAQGAAIGGVLFSALGSGVGAAVARPARTEVYRASVAPARGGEVRSAP